MTVFIIKVMKTSLCFKWQYTIHEVDECSHSEKCWKGKTMMLFFSIGNDIQRGFKLNSEYWLGKHQELGTHPPISAVHTVRVCLWVWAPSMLFLPMGLVYLSFFIVSFLTDVTIKPNIYYLLCGWNSLVFPMVKRSISYTFLWERLTAADLEHLGLTCL